MRKPVAKENLVNPRGITGVIPMVAGLGVWQSVPTILPDQFSFIWRDKVA